jgi:hypothetical protein
MPLMYGLTIYLTVSGWFSQGRYVKHAEKYICIYIQVYFTFSHVFTCMKIQVFIHKTPYRLVINTASYFWGLETSIHAKFWLWNRERFITCDFYPASRGIIALKIVSFHDIPSQNIAYIFYISQACSLNVIPCFHPRLINHLAWFHA